MRTNRFSLRNKYQTAFYSYGFLFNLSVWMGLELPLRCCEFDWLNCALAAPPMSEACSRAVEVLVVLNLLNDKYYWTTIESYTIFAKNRILSSYMYLPKYFAVTLTYNQRWIFTEPQSVLPVKVKESHITFNSLKTKYKLL